MESPDSIKNNHVFLFIKYISLNEPTINTIIILNIKTTSVLKANATLVLVVFTPFFKNIVVNPAAIAESDA